MKSAVLDKQLNYTIFFFIYGKNILIVFTVVQSIQNKLNPDSPCTRESTADQEKIQADACATRYSPEYGLCAVWKCV